MRSIHTPSLLSCLLVLTGCTKLETVSKAEILDAAGDGDGIIIPDAGPGEDSGSGDGGSDGGMISGELCNVPAIPPRLPAVSLDEKPCSMSTEEWPDCIPDTCEAPDFETACKELCQMTCERERWFCTRTHCPTPAADSGFDTYCDTSAAITECMDLCDGDVSCLQTACQEKQGVSCAELDCPPGESNSCGGLMCDNTCDFSTDSQCDDGSPVNATRDDCELGTDCADCGARAACFELGAECFSTAQCCGFEDKKAWCVNVGTDDKPLGRCVPDCSQSANDCPDQFSCLDLRSDDMGNAERACFPLCSLSQ